MPKTKCTSEAQNTPWAAKKKDSRQPSIPSRRTTNHKLANDKKLPEKGVVQAQSEAEDNSYIPMRYSGLMQAERRPSSLSSVTNKRLRKQIVFEIGETIHSGPTHLVQKDIKNEKLGPASNCVFPGDTLESACALPESNCPADIPSTRCSSSQLSSTSAYRKGSVPRKPSSSVGAVALPRLSQSNCKVSDAVEPKAPLLTVQVPEAVVPKAKVIIHDALAVPQASVSEATIPDVTVSEAALPEVTLVEAALPDVPVTKAVFKATSLDVATKVKQEKETPCAFKPVIKQELPDFVESALDDYSLDVALSPVVDAIRVKKENIEMVRLIQEVDSRIDSFCHKRSSRTSKRFGSSEIEEIEIKTEPMSRAKRCTRTRKSSCRSDKSESETSDSRSVLEDPLCLDMVDKTAKRGKPKNGEPILDEAAAHTNKYNGDVSVDLVNGAHKVKGRRVSRANSDESDLSSCSKTNGNVDHNNDKIDFSLLLEISEADREKFETKKAKIRRKTADWLLISETEQYYNEKEEIMRNKNKPDSESDSDGSDSDSKSDCSDDNENEDANLPRGRGKGKRKQPGCAGDDVPKVSAKRIKEDLDSSNVRGRPIGSRTRKTRYDLTMLNDDEDDDDENFFGFPVSTTIPPSTESCSLTSGSLCQSRSKGKGTTKVPSESSSSGKAGKKRLSDAERFLRDNREYYHFQETKERLRRSTSSSSGDKEKVGNGDDTSCHIEKHSEKKEESKVRETSLVSRKRPSLDMARRVTRRTGGSLDLECEGDKKISIKEEKDLRMEGRNATRSERRDGFRLEKRVEVKAERIDYPRKDGTRSEKKTEGKNERNYACCDKKDTTKAEKRDKEKLKDDKEKVNENKKSKEGATEKCGKEDIKGKVDDTKEKVNDTKEKTEDKKEKVDDTKERIEDRKEKVVDKKEKVADKIEKVEDKNEKVEDKREKVEDKRERVEDKRERVKDKKERVEDKKERVEDKKEKVEDKRERVEDKKERVEDKKERVKDKKERVEDKKEKVEDKKEKVEEKRESVEDKKEKVEDKKEKVEDKKEKVEDKNEKVEDKRERVEDKRERVEDKKEKVEDKKEKVEDKKEKAEDKKEKAEDKKEKVEDKKEKVEDKTEKVLDKTEKAEDQKEKVEIKKEKIIESNKKLEDKLEKVEDKKESEEEVIRDERKKVVTEEEKVKEVNKKKELKDENKNGLKEKEIGELLDQKLSLKNDTQILKSGVGVGKCIIKTEKDSIKTSEISDSFESSINDKVKSDDIESREKLEVREKVTNAGYGNNLDELYFSFEGVPENECWYQTYQRFIDGIAVNEFVYDEDPLKFILPYEMPREYIRDFISLKKGLFCKKKNDLADLVRKSPRCHASTLALFSDIIPTRRGKGSKGLKSVPVKVEEISSDGTSTPGADSIRMPPHECFESVEELAILALHLDHVIKTELDGEEASLRIPVLKDMKDTDETDLRKTPPKKRGKKRRLLANSKSSKGVENIVKEMKMFESPFAHEVDPAFIAGLSDDVRDLVPENILSRAAVEVIEDSSQCLCNDRPSCEDFSSADENTEASSECVSLCDSETIDSSTASEPKPVRSNKKRRKNLTGWPKAQKKKKSVASHTSDDNDSAFGYDDSEPKRRGCRIKQDFCFLEQTTAQKLAALAANDRRASPRKKASVLYMDTWPVRFRTQK